MSVGSVGKWLSMGLLVASLGAVGCGDDDENSTKDAGGGSKDSGTSDGGGTNDAGTSDGGGSDDGGSMDSGTPGNSCPDSPGSMNACCDIDGKSTLCEFFQGGLGPVNAGCAKNPQGATVCGISSNILLNGAEPKFLEKNAPGAPSPSCAAFYDKLERKDDGGPGDYVNNGFIDTERVIGAAALKLRYQGCCTTNGFCTISGTDGGLQQASGSYGPSDNGYGCLNPLIAFGRYPADAGPALGNLNLQQIPCDMGTGVIKVNLGGGDAGTDAGTDAATDASADAAGG